MSRQFVEGPRVSRPLGLVQRIFGGASSVPTVPVFPESGTRGPGSLLADFGSLSGGAVELRAASLRGLSHQHDGSRRQDSYTVLSSDDRIVVAVADGVGSARLSHVGSEIASRTAAAMIMEQSSGEAAIKAVLAGMRAETNRSGADLDDLATTLLVVLVEVGDAGLPWLVRVAEWGDSRASVFAPGVVIDGHPDWRHICPDPTADYANTVRSLPRFIEPTTYATGFWMPGEVLLAASDGIDAQLDSRNSVGHGLAEAWTEVPGIAQFIADVSFDRAGARDDRTAVCLFRPDSPQDAA